MHVVSTVIVPIVPSVICAHESLLPRYLHNKDNRQTHTYTRVRMFSFSPSGKIAAASNASYEWSFPLGKFHNSTTHRQVSSLCELCLRKLRQRIISSVVLCRLKPREIRISSVVDCLRIDGRGAHSTIGKGGGRAHGLASLGNLKKHFTFLSVFTFKLNISIELCILTAMNSSYLNRASDF